MTIKFINGQDLFSFSNILPARRTSGVYLVKSSFNFNSPGDPSIFIIDSTGVSGKNNGSSSGCDTTDGHQGYCHRRCVQDVLQKDFGRREIFIWQVNVHVATSSSTKRPFISSCNRFRLDFDKVYESMMKSRHMTSSTRGVQVNISRLYTYNTSKRCVGKGGVSLLVQRDYWRFTDEQIVVVGPFIFTIRFGFG